MHWTYCSFALSYQYSCLLQIATVERDLTEITQQLSDKEERVIELEAALDERQLVLQQSNSRITELEEAQTQLESAVSEIHC